MQLCQYDFGSTPPKLVILMNVGGNTTPVICDGNRVVPVNRDDDVITMSCQCFVNRVVDDLEHHVVQTRSIGRITDVHARTLAHSLQALEHLDRIGAIGVTVFGSLIRYLIVI